MFSSDLKCIQRYLSEDWDHRGELVAAELPLDPVVVARAVRLSPPEVVLAVVALFDFEIIPKIQFDYVAFGRWNNSDV
jgi:hypothetical protein